MRTIPLIRPDLPAFDEVADEFRAALESGRITNFGTHVAELERQAGDYLGTHVATVSSGTAGLLLSLLALGVRPGQKVILPSFTFVATAQAVLLTGATPVFAEIEQDLTVSPADLALLLRKHAGEVGAVIPVHMYGLPARVDELQSTLDDAGASGMPVVYDAAHAFGSAIGDRRVGTFGNAEVFSLSVTKVLVSVEGGMISSRDAGLIQRIRKMRNYGIQDNYDAWWPGLNSKMSELHAIVGVHNLRHLSERMAIRQAKASCYAAKIEQRTGFRTIGLPLGQVSTFKDFTIVVPTDMKHQRDALIALLASRGIETRAYFYPPVHEQRFFRRFADRALPTTEDLARRVITLPFYTSMTHDEMDYVVDVLAEAWQARTALTAGVLTCAS